MCCIAWATVGLIIFVVLFFVTAPYGRYNSLKWGKSVSTRMGWILMEIPAFVVFPTVVVGYWIILDISVNLPISIFLFLWCFHYFNRTFIYPLRIRNKPNSMALITMLSGIVFNTISGVLLGYWFGVINNNYPISWLTSWQLATGLIIFIIGMGINWRSDDLLIQLLRRRSKDNEYLIPRGGLFRWVSCPNYLGEIIEWIGFAIMTGALPTILFSWWVCANLIPRSIAHHRDYQKKFDEYPPERRAILPYVL